MTAINCFINFLNFFIIKGAVRCPYIKSLRSLATHHLIVGIHRADGNRILVPAQDVEVGTGIEPANV